MVEKNDYDPYDPYSIDDFMEPGMSFIEIDSVLDDIEDIDINNEAHYDF